MKRCSVIVNGKQAGWLRGYTFDEFFAKAASGRKAAKRGRRHGAKLKGGKP